LGKKLQINIPGQLLVINLKFAKEIRSERKREGRRGGGGKDESEKA